jgi:PIN domain nuclease of toxin-antitoxin system
VRALLDTHALIWLASDDPSLSVAARGVIIDTSNEVFLSSATAWEMAIKIGLGKLTVPVPLETLISSQVAQHRIKLLRIEFEHAYLVRSLPHFHADPFDRLLIAQAIAENLVLLTRDPEFARYGVPTLW